MKKEKRKLSKVKKILRVILFILIGFFVLLVLVAIFAKPPAQQPVAAETQDQQSVQVEPTQQQPVSEEPPPQTSVSSNLLMRASLIEAPVLNGFNQRIGTRAYITMPQEILLEVVTLEDVTEFYLSFQGRGYNWVSIICPEGTGLIFGGAGDLASFGKMDETGRLAGETMWTIFYDENIGTFRAPLTD